MFWYINPYYKFILIHIFIKIIYNNYHINKYEEKL